MAFLRFMRERLFLSGCGGSLTAVYAGMADFGRCFWVGNVTFFKILSNNFRDTKQALSQVAVRKLNFLLMSLIIFFEEIACVRRGAHSLSYLTFAAGSPAEELSSCSFPYLLFL